MLRILEWVFAWVAAIICLSITLLFWQTQQRMGGPLWPMPAFTLLEVACLSFLGLLSVALDTDPDRMAFGAITWLVAGALAGLVILGGFSIGLFLVPAVLFLATAAFLARRRRKRRFLPELASFAIGTTGSILLLLFINVLM
jgi:hypothetical protein